FLGTLCVFLLVLSFVVSVTPRLFRGFGFDVAFLRDVALMSSSVLFLFLSIVHDCLLVFCVPVCPFVFPVVGQSRELRLVLMLNTRTQVWKTTTTTRSARISAC